MSDSIKKNFYRSIHLDDLTLAYSGNFTDSMTENIIDLSETYLNSNEKLSRLRKRTSFLVAECFQNVVRHSMKDHTEAHKSRLNESFFLRFYENRCYIASENLIPNSQVEGLKAQLEQVNNSDQDELKSLYLHILNEGKISEKGGAGLGLVEMARKTGNRLVYSFEDDDEVNSLFYLMLVLENHNVDGPVTDKSKDLLSIKQIIRNVQKDNMFLLYKGDFELDILEHIEQILESNLDSQHDSMATKIKLYQAAILTMHKIGQYSHGKDERKTGMLFFGRTDDAYMINATFPVNDVKKANLDTILKEIYGLSREELDQKYQEQLKMSAKENMSLSGLGFTQLARISKSWSYEFDSPENLFDEFVYQIYV